MENNTFLLYGANGYTGRIIAEMAREYGLRPILAGRNATAIKTQSRPTGFGLSVFDLNDQRKFRKRTLGCTHGFARSGSFFQDL